jgi:hypothetical protein
MLVFYLFFKKKKVIASILSHHETLPFKKYIFAPKDEFRATTIEANHSF